MKNKSEIVFLLILLQAGQAPASQNAVSDRLHDVKRIQLVTAMQDADKALAVVKSNGLRKYFTVLLQDVVETLEGERVGGDYVAMKINAQQLKDSHKYNYNVDEVVSAEIRSAIVEHAIKKYGYQEVQALLQKSENVRK